MKRRRILPYLERLWVTDIALTTLLVFLLIYIFFLYPLGQVGAFRALTTAFWSLILIMGAVAAYLILGLIWSLAYYLIALRIPEAFGVQGSFALDDREALQSHLLYFSFITLTTLGYGDIVPVHPMARMLVILEGVTG